MPSHYSRRYSRRTRKGPLPLTSACDRILLPAMACRTPPSRAAKRSAAGGGSPRRPAAGRCVAPGPLGPGRIPSSCATEPPNDAVLGDAPGAGRAVGSTSRCVSDFAATEVTLARRGASTRDPAALRCRRTAATPPRLSVSPPQSLDEGDYLVRWRITSAEDGSVSEGEYAFSISSSAPAVSASEEERRAGHPLHVLDDDGRHRRGSLPRPAAVPRSPRPGSSAAIPPPETTLPEHH